MLVQCWVILGKMALVTKALMTMGNRFQSELGMTALTLLPTIITKRKIQLEDTYLCCTLTASAHRSMHWTLISFLVPCWTPALPSSFWILRRKGTNSSQCSCCGKINFYDPLFALPSLNAFLCLSPLIVPFCTTNSSLTVHPLHP